jgi:hypothetical protein
VVQPALADLSLIEHTVRATGKACDYETPNYGAHILKRFDVQVFAFVPVERLDLQLVSFQFFCQTNWGTMEAAGGFWPT